MNNTEIVTVSLLPQSKVQLEVDARIQLFESSLATRIISFIDYFRIVTQSNNFISSLNTNAAIVHSTYERVKDLYSMSTYYYSTTITDNNTRVTNPIYCGTVHTVTRAAICSTLPLNFSSLLKWTDPTEDCSLVKGFYTGCMPFESILQTTFDCLYEIECLQLLVDNFPCLNQLNLNLSNEILVESESSNKTLYEHLSNLLIDEWNTTMNYSSYLSNCNPRTCQFSSSEKINYSYAITLFIGLYGGLIVILRSISLFLIQSVNQRISIRSLKMFPRTTLVWIKQLNLFKNVNERSENDLQQQRMTTRIYLSLLLSKFLNMCNKHKKQFHI